MIHKPLILDLNNPEIYDWIVKNTYDGHGTLNLHQSIALTLCDLSWDSLPRFNNKSPAPDEKFYYKTKFVIDQVYGFGNDAGNMAEWRFLHHTSLSEYGVIYNLAPVKMPDGIELDDDGEWGHVDKEVNEVHIWSGCGATVTTTPMELDDSIFDNDITGPLLQMASILFGLPLLVIGSPLALEVIMSLAMFGIEKALSKPSDDLCGSASITMTPGGCQNIMEKGQPSNQYPNGKMMMLRRRSDYPNSTDFSYGKDTEEYLNGSTFRTHNCGKQIEMNSSFANGQKAMWDMCIHVDGPFKFSKDENGNDVEVRIDAKSMKPT